jgi:hypothetical protein
MPRTVFGTITAMALAGSGTGHHPGSRATLLWGVRCPEACVAFVYLDEAPGVASTRG